MVLTAGGMGTRTYAWNLDPPGIEENGELVNFPDASGKENGTETTGGNNWTSGLEGGTTVAILSDEPSTISLENSSNLNDFLTGVSITDEDGNPIKDNTLYDGENYKIHLEFTEGGAQSKQFGWEAGGTMTYQLPGNFEVQQQGPIELKVNIDGEEVTVGTYSVDAGGKITVQLTSEGQAALNESNNVKIAFDMDATAKKTEGETEDEDFNFGIGEKFKYKVTYPPAVSMDKTGEYEENGEKTGGKLKYTVTAKVEHGPVENVVIEDKLTPPNTAALRLKMETRDEEGEKVPDVTVTVKKAGGEGEVTLTPGEDYVLVPIEPKDPGNPYAPQTFKVQFKGDYEKLQEGDEVNVTYNYNVEYVSGTTDLFWGNVVNVATATGTMTIPGDDPGDPTGDKEVPFTEEWGSNVEIKVVPAGKWDPLFIYDDMYVEYDGVRWYLPHGTSRVQDLTVKAVDIEGNWFDEWNESTSDPDKIKDLEELKKTAEETEPLKDYNYNLFSDGVKPAEYIPGLEGITENYVYRYRGHMLHIIFGADASELNDGSEGKWGRWEYSKDRLIITEYDLDMSDMTPDDKITLVSGKDYETTMEMSPGDILLAGITNNVYLRYSGHYPGYAVFFNNKEKMNKEGKLDANTNTIDYTVTMNTTDSTVWQYFLDVRNDWSNSAKPKFEGGNENWDYNTNGNMHAVFYDVLPDGWEYVEDSLSATAQHNYGGEEYFPFNAKRYGEQPVKTIGENNVIEAPLVLFYNTDDAFHELINTFGSTLTQITFRYKVKVKEDWLKDHVNTEEAIKLINHAEIRDKNNQKPHWEKDAEVSYFPPRITKQVEQEKDEENGVYTNLLKFTLQVNPNALTLSKSNEGYLIVRDTSEGIEIQTSTIKVTDAEGNELEKISITSEDDTLEANQCGMLPVTEEGQFRIKVPDGVALTITYDALIPGEGENIEVSNKAEIEGVEKGGSEYSGGFKVNSIRGMGEGSTYKMAIEKVDSSDRAKKLEGAEFEFYIVVKKDSDLDKVEDPIRRTKIVIDDKEYDVYREDNWTVKTNAEGRFEIINDTMAVNWRLEPGNYYILKETKAPAGYESLEKPIIFYYGPENTMKEDEYPGVQLVLPDSEKPLTIADPPTPYELPETGGFGTAYLYLMGSVFVLMGGAFLLYNRRLAHRRTGR